MSSKNKICLIGDVVVDVSLKGNNPESKLRLGGIVHAARGLWALDIPFGVGYYAPEYLDSEIKNYLEHLGCIHVVKLGNITGAPYVFLIDDAKESGNQGYEFLLKDDIRIEYYKEGEKEIEKGLYTDYMVISGNFDLVDQINRLANGRIHLDVANNCNEIEILSELNRKIETIFLSTSSGLFLNYFDSNFTEFLDQFSSLTTEVVLKENRGGSRARHFSTNKNHRAFAQPRKISHSVGVGDVFDVTYICGKHTEIQNKLTLSSWIAAEYAVTSFPDDFKRGVGRVLKSSIEDLLKLKGVSLAWEDRENINIYIAAPDFTHVDTTIIDKLCEALTYHNFRPRRPVKENGQMEENASKFRKQQLVDSDIVTLHECSLVIGVLLFNDPGTLIELGYSVAKDIPTILYDPYLMAENCMLTELPTFVSHDIDEIITEVFIKGANIVNNGE